MSATCGCGRGRRVASCGRRGGSDDGVRVAEVGVAEAPATDAIVPRLVSAPDVVVSQLFDGLERVEASVVDGCDKKVQISSSSNTYTQTND